jgi:probable HAF family extracellular repeat protein
MFVHAPLPMHCSLRRAKGRRLPGVLMLSILVASLSASMACAGPGVTIAKSPATTLEIALTFAVYYNVLGRAPGTYSVAQAPSVSSQTLFYITYTPLIGPDPVVATPQPLGNAQVNSISPSGIAATSNDIISVGASETGTHGPYHAFRNSLATGATTDLGALGGAAATSFAFGISDDGSAIVGTSFLSPSLTGPEHAFRIGADGVMTDLGSLAGANGNSIAFAANGDGSVVVGQTGVTGGGQHAFRWVRTPGSDSGAMTDLGGSGSVATAVNFDGSVAVGANTVNVIIGTTHTSRLHAALWTAAGSPVDLGVLPGDVALIATGVSADGTVVVGISDPVLVSGQTGIGGYGFNGATSHAFVWTQATGMQNLTTLLTQAGALASGSSLAAALGIARNGQDIAGAGVFPGTTPTGSTTGYQARYCTGNCPDDSAPLLAAVLPASRSIEVGGTATAFATIINPSKSNLSNCFITPAAALPVSFIYQTTNPATNALTGTANTPVSIPAGGAQSFVFALTANAAFPPTNVTLGFECTYAGEAGVITGLDTLLLSASATPVPDVVALGATTKNDGIVHVTGTPMAGAFAVATVNLGASSTITAAANTGGATLPLSISICQTNPQSGQCLQTPGPTATTTINANATPTFAVFVNASGTVPFDPANNRIFVTFSDSTNAVRGGTSVAVETQ